MILIFINLAWVIFFIIGYRKLTKTRIGLICFSLIPAGWFSVGLLFTLIMMVINVDSVLFSALFGYGITVGIWFFLHAKLPRGVFSYRQLLNNEYERVSGLTQEIFSKSDFVNVIIVTNDNKDLNVQSWGNTIIVSQGTLRMLNDSELQGILASEISQIKHGYSAERLDFYWSERINLFFSKSQLLVILFFIGNIVYNIMRPFLCNKIFEHEKIFTADDDVFNWGFSEGLIGYLEKEDSITAYDYASKQVQANYFDSYKPSPRIRIDQLTRSSEFVTSSVVKDVVDIVEDSDVYVIGVNNHKNVYISDKESNQHKLLVGTTGAGKTTAILNDVVHCAKNGLPCLYLDGKGSQDLITRMAQIANDYGRIFKVFTIKPHLLTEQNMKYAAAYNPLVSGTVTELKNRLMSLFSQAEGKGQEHFAIAEERFINIVVNILKDKPIDLSVLTVLLSDIDLLKEVAKQENKLDELKRLESVDTTKTRDVANMLELFIHSSYGQYFDTKKSNNVLAIRDAINNNEIVLFLFDSSAYKSDTEKLAKMVINDINSTFSQLAEPKITYCIFDEFASYASSNLSDTITLHRSNGLCATIGTQSVTTVGLKSPDTERIAKELIACCNTYLVLPINFSEDVELMAQTLGTRPTFEITTQLNINETQGATGLGTSKFVDEFIVHPQKIRDLKTGEAYIYKKSAGMKALKINVNNTGY